jgi:predicted DNA repair protein MutK
VATATFSVRVAVLVGIGLLMTVGVYGIVAAIVKLDDAGLYLGQLRGQGVLVRMVRRVGLGMVAFAPWLMKVLSVLGTAAMFLVGGGILAHGIPWFEHRITDLRELDAGGLEFLLHAMTPLVANLVIGTVAGALALLVVELVKKVRSRRAESAD